MRSRSRPRRESQRAQHGATSGLPYRFDGRGSLKARGWLGAEGGPVRCEGLERTTTARGGAIVYTCGYRPDQVVLGCCDHR
eukprot:1135869-Prymnesium_polylepis.1